MRLRRKFWLALPLLAATPASARQAQVMTFPAGEYKGPATDVSGAGWRSEDAVMADRLVADFAILDISPTPESTILPRSSISIPAWMQLGRPLAFGAVPSSAVPAALACRAMAYRPRLDLGWRTEGRRLRLYPMIAQVACEEGVPVGLFDALIAQESRYDISARSPKGAIGLAQLMPDTASALGVQSPWDPIANLRGGAHYLRSHLLEFGRVDLALAAYNAGPGRVRQLRRVPAFRETRNYVQTIIQAWTDTSRPPFKPSTPASYPMTNSKRSAQMLTFASADTTL